LSNEFSTVTIFAPLHLFTLFALHLKFRIHRQCSSIILILLKSSLHQEMTQAAAIHFSVSGMSCLSYIYRYSYPCRQACSYMLITRQTSLNVFFVLIASDHHNNSSILPLYPDCQPLLGHLRTWKICKNKPHVRKHEPCQVATDLRSNTLHGPINPNDTYSLQIFSPNSIGPLLHSHHRGHDVAGYGTIDEDSVYRIANTTKVLVVYYSLFAVEDGIFDDRMWYCGR
jgi:hypothetical protein